MIKSILANRAANKQFKQDAKFIFPRRKPSSNGKTVYCKRKEMARASTILPPKTDVRVCYSCAEHKPASEFPVSTFRIKKCRVCKFCVELDKRGIAMAIEGDASLKTNATMPILLEEEEATNKSKSLSDGSFRSVSSIASEPTEGSSIIPLENIH